MSYQSPLFVSHGAPDLPLRDIPAARFLKSLFQTRVKPDAIVILSAHWGTRGNYLTSSEKLETIYDFGGFGQELYELDYPAKTSSSLLMRISNIAQNSNVALHKTPKRGLDHGAWIPLKLMFPKADIPVAQLSLNYDLSPLNLYKLGRQFSVLSEENILVIGSGASVHNLRYASSEGSRPASWATSFEEWTSAVLQKQDWDQLFKFDQSEFGVMAHPTPEHFLPLIFIAGVAQNANIKTIPRRLHHSFSYGSIGMSTWEFLDAS